MIFLNHIKIIETVDYKSKNFVQMRNRVKNFNFINSNAPNGFYNFYVELLRSEWFNVLLNILPSLSHSNKNSMNI